MAIYEVTNNDIEEVRATSFADAGLWERRDLQRLLRERIDVIAPGVLVIAEEFSRWGDSKRRIDLLGVDGDANLVVFELKRDEDGGHMDLQALRYAAMISPLTFADAVATYAEYLRARGVEGDAERLLLDHLGWGEAGDGAFNQSVRAVLVAADFSKEITSTVVWLGGYGVDIRCVRMRPHRLSDRLLIDVQQIIPLPEVADYQVRLQEKAQQERGSGAMQSGRSERHHLRYEFWQGLLELARERSTLHARTRPGYASYVSASAGRAGISYGYDIHGHSGRVSFYLYRSQEENKAIFDRLMTSREAIEDAFGESLEWNRNDGARGSDVAKTITIGGYRDRDRWPEIQGAMIDAMVRLERAFRPHIDQL